MARGLSRVRQVWCRLRRCFARPDLLKPTDLPALPGDDDWDPALEGISDGDDKESHDASDEEEASQEEAEALPAQEIGARAGSRRPARSKVAEQTRRAERIVDVRRHHGRHAVSIGSDGAVYWSRRIPGFGQV